MSDSPIRCPGPSRQVSFHQLLVSARRTWLIDALSEALTGIDPEQLKMQLLEYVPTDAQQLLAGAGIRDEHVFPTPVILEAMPSLLAYYRLLLGAPQKTFYQGHTGLGRFKSMEKDSLSQRQIGQLPNLCRTMSLSLADLVRQISPTVTPRDIAELPLLTLGSFFQGANNVIIGKQATEAVFLAIGEIVERHRVSRTETELRVKNSARRPVVLTLGTDPDVRIEEEVSGRTRKKVAIEIKGGTDKSNAHNRAGEAEKSHQKAKNKGYRDFWTLIAKKGLDAERLAEESPTTTSWFDISQVLGRQGDDWDEFKSRIAEAVGIPLETKRTVQIRGQ